MGIKEHFVGLRRVGRQPECATGAQLHVLLRAKPVPGTRTFPQPHARRCRKFYREYRRLFSACIFVAAKQC